MPPPPVFGSPGLRELAELPSVVDSLKAPTLATLVALVVGAYDEDCDETTV